jgi:hypothetical protein
MKLSVKDRMALNGLLPREGTFANMKILHELRMHLSLSEEEHKELSVSETPQSDGRLYLTWDADAAAKADKEIPIGEKANDLLVEELKKLNEEGKLTEDTYPLYDRFVESKR